MGHLLPDNFYTMPDKAEKVVDRKELKKILLGLGGRIIACGVLYDIKNKHLGAGIYKIFLKRTN